MSLSPWRRRGSVASELEASEAHVLHLQILVQAVLGALPAQTRLFDATEGGLGAGNEALVDSNHPHLQRLGHPPDLAHVLGVEVAWEQKQLVTVSKTRTSWGSLLLHVGGAVVRHGVAGGTPLHRRSDQAGLEPRVPNRRAQRETPTC